MQEAFLKTVEASKLAGLRGILMHAIDDQAELFYKHYGFSETPVDLTLFMTIEDITKNLLE